jgi:hypothetical protein
LLFVATTYGWSKDLRENVRGILTHKLGKVEEFHKKATALKQKHGVADMTVECGLCSIAINEIEGMMAENLTQTEMEQKLQADVCSLLSGSMAQICDGLVDQIPTVVNMIEQSQSVGVVCVELQYCNKPYTPHPDPWPVPRYVLNLDLPPNQRWTEICSNETYVNVSHYLVDTIDGVLPGGGKEIEAIGTLLNSYYFPQEYAQEIQGCAAALGISVGWATIFNLGYEVSDACTSIVAQTDDGKIYHARNLDFWDGMGFTNTLKDAAFEVEFQKGGNTLFHATSFVSFVGVLSGMKPNAFSVTIDTRFYPNGLGELFYEVIAAIIERNASLVTFLSRDVFMNENNFNAAVNNLANGELIADVYYIVAGVSAGEGAVISRNRNNASDIWMLDSPSRWFEVETNYDHWKQPPWFDNRVTPADNGMTAMGQTDLSLEGMFQVLSTKPVLNLQTTYSILSCPADSFYQSFVRYCEYPCVE